MLKNTIIYDFNEPFFDTDYTVIIYPSNLYKEYNELSSLLLKDGIISSVKSSKNTFYIEGKRSVTEIVNLFSKYGIYN
jgi:hypothetical protein